jgi:hypothetical protein
MEILGGSGDGTSASQESGDPSLLLAESTILNGSVDSLPLHEKSYLSDISDSVVLMKPKDAENERSRNKKSSTRTKIK